MLANATTQPATDVFMFYSTAFGHLLTVLAIAIALFLALFGIIGFLVPWLMERTRQRRFELDRDKIVAEIAKTRKTLDERIGKAHATIAEAQKQFDEKLAQSLGKIDKVTSDIRFEMNWSHLCSVQGVGSAPIGQFKTALEGILSTLRLPSKVHRTKWPLFARAAVDLFERNLLEIGQVAGNEEATEQLKHAITALRSAGESPESYQFLVQLLNDVLAHTPTDEQAD